MRCDSPEGQIASPAHCGKFGRACLWARQYQSRPHFKLAQWLIAAVAWLSRLLPACPPPPRTIRLDNHDTPVLIYTSGAWLDLARVTEKHLCGLGVGGVLIDGDHTEYLGGRVRERVGQRMVARCLVFAWLGGRCAWACVGHSGWQDTYPWRKYNIVSMAISSAV